MKSRSNRIPQPRARATANASTPASTTAAAMTTGLVNVTSAQPIAAHHRSPMTAVMLRSCSHVPPAKAALVGEDPLLERTRC